MNEQQILQMFATNTAYVLIFGILIGALFSIATLAAFEAIKAYNANKREEERVAAAKKEPTAKKKVAVKKVAVSKAPAKKAGTKKKK